MANTIRGRIVDKGVDCAYKAWDGRPLQIDEIASMANTSEKTVKQTLQSAMKKLRCAAPAHMQEYLQD